MKLLTAAIEKKSPKAIPQVVLEYNKRKLPDMMKRKEIIGDCTLYLGDCLEIMPTLDNVDCVVTDPPYKLVAGGMTRNDMGGKFNLENYNNNGSIVDCDVDWLDFMPLISRLVNIGHIYIMCNNRHVNNMLTTANSSGMKFHNLLVWDKVSPTPNRWYMKGCEFTGFFYKGKAKVLNDCGSKQLIKIPLPKDNFHPTVKPVALMEHYIENSTVRGQSALDPFMGSGTTGVACAKLGRKFIGIELDEDYFNIACDRIRKAYDQPDLFIEPPKNLQQIDLSWDDG